MDKKGNSLYTLKLQLNSLKVKGDICFLSFSHSFVCPLAICHFSFICNSLLLLLYMNKWIYQITVHLIILSDPSLTWLYWIFYAEHGRPVSVAHGFQHFLLGHVGPSCLHPDAGFDVVEISAVQLKELDKQDAQVDVGTTRVDPRM